MYGDEVGRVIVSDGFSGEKLDPDKWNSGGNSTDSKDESSDDKINNIEGNWKGVYNFKNTSTDFNASINISGDTFEGNTSEIGNPTARLTDGKILAGNKIVFTKIYDNINLKKVYYTGEIKDDGSIQGTFIVGSGQDDESLKGVFSMQKVRE